MACPSHMIANKPHDVPSTLVHIKHMMSMITSREKAAGTLFPLHGHLFYPSESGSMSRVGGPQLTSMIPTFCSQGHVRLVGCLQGAPLNLPGTRTPEKYIMFAWLVESKGTPKKQKGELILGKLMADFPDTPCCGTELRLQATHRTCPSRRNPRPAVGMACARRLVLPSGCFNFSDTGVIYVDRF